MTALADLTDEQVLEAVRFAMRHDRDGIARGSSTVLSALTDPPPERWPVQPCPENAQTGLGLLPRFETKPASVTARLKRLERDGRVVRVAMVHPRGKPAPPGWRIP